MTQVNGDMLTMLDQAKRTDPDGNTADIVELLMEENDVLQDAISVEGNGPTHHRTTVRTGLPNATWRRLNYGVGRSKSRTAQVDDGYGMLEQYADIDVDVIALADDEGTFRMSEEAPFREKFNQDIASTIIYGNTDTNPERFLGMAERYNDVAAPNATHLFFNDTKAAVDGAGDNTSLYFINWAPTKTFLSFPKGKKAGLAVNDKGQVTVDDADGGIFEAMRTHYKWDVGLVLRDWRYSARLTHISPTLLAGDTLAVEADALFNKMIDVYHTIESVDSGLRIYANRTMRAWFHKLAMSRTNTRFTIEEFGGKPIPSFLGIPIRLNDQILNNESTITGG